MPASISRIEHLFPTATCTGCQKELPVSEFRADRAKPRGRDTRCKACTHERDTKRKERHLAFRAEAIAQGHRKICAYCKVEKLIADFCADGLRQGGSTNECKDCFKARHAGWRSDNSEHVRAFSRASMREIRRNEEQRKRGNAATRRSRLKTKYGLTEAAFEVMREAQDNKCAICRTAFSEKAWGGDSVNIDHDHVTGAVRALLCTLCNTAIGYFRDNIEVMKMAVTYLEKHGASPKKRYKNAG